MNDPLMPPCGRDAWIPKPGLCSQLLFYKTCRTCGRYYQNRGKCIGMSAPLVEHALREGRKI